MPGGLGDVNVRVNLDTSPLFAEWKKVQNTFGEPIKGNPTEGLEKGFERTAKAAKKLGFEWNAATQTFQGDGGKFNSTLDQMEANIKSVKDQAKLAGGSFGKFAELIKKSGAEASGLKGTTKTLADQLKNIQATAAAGAAKIATFGIASKNAGTAFGVLGTNAGILNNALKGVGQGGTEGLKNIGGIAADTGSKLKGLATEAQTTSASVKQLGQGGNQGLKNISNDANGATKKLDGLEDQANAAKTALKSIGGGATGLTNLASLVGKSEISFKAATDSAHRLKNAIEGTGKAGKPLGTLAKAIQGVGTAGKNAKAPTSALTKLLDRAAATAAPLTALPPKIRAVGTAATAAKTATKGMGAELIKAADQSKTFSGAVQQGFQQILQGIPQGIGMAIGNALIAPLKLLTQIVPAAISQYRDLDEVLRLTLAIAGESSENFGRLSESVKKVGAASAATNQEVGQVAQGLARAGFSLDEIEAALAGVVQGAEATGMGYAEMGDIVVSSLGQFQLGAEKTTEAVDSMVTAANSSNQTVSDLGNALKYVGPIANTVGQSLDETNVQLALLANSGIRASTAGTSLRTILTNLQIAAGGAGEEFTELSRGSARLQKTLSLIGADMTDTNGALKTGTDLIYALQTSMKTLSAGERAIVSKVLAGSEGLPALSAIVNATGEDIELLAEKMDNKLGSAADTQKKAMEGLSGSLKFFESNLSTLLASVGQFASAIFKPLVDGATFVLAAFNQIPGPIQSILFTLATLATVAGAVKLALMALKIEIVATFAAKTVAMIKAFTAAITSGGVQGALLSMATNAGKLASVLKANLVAAIASSTTALDLMTLKLKAANAQLFIKNATKGIKQLDLFANAAKNGIKTTDGKVSILSKLKDAFNKGTGPAAKATTQLELFDTAGKGAAKGLSTAAKASGKYSAAMAKVAAPAGAAATATAGVGTAGTGAGLGIKALIGSIGGFIGALAPFLPLIVGVGAAIKGLIDYTSGYNEVQKKLEGDTIKLNKIIHESVDANEASEEATKKWSESLQDALGPLGHILNLFPRFKVLKLGIDLIQGTGDALNRFFGYFKDNGKIDALRDSMVELGKANIDAKNKIKQNQEAMQGLDVVSEDYNNLLQENINIQQGVVDANKSRINKLKEELKILEAAGQGNDRVAQAIEKQLKVLEKVTPRAEKRLQNLRDESTLTDALAGRGKTLANSYQTVMRARNDANGSIDSTLSTKLIQNQALLSQGLIDESVAVARNAKAHVDANNEKLAADEKALKDLQALRAEEKITETKFIELKNQIVDKVKNGAKERLDAETKLKDAIKTAINERLDAYQAEQQSIAANVQAINSSLGELGTINVGAISAFKSLADASTAYEMTGIEKAKAAKLRAIDATYKDGETKEKMKQKVEKEFLREKKRILQDQQTFAETAQQATFAAKNAELSLWYAQATIQNQIAQVEAQIAIERAKANGASASEIAALQRVKGLTEFQGQMINDQLGLKRELLGIENQAAQAGLAAKARADGTKTAFAGSVENVSALAIKMQAFTGKVQAVQDKALAFKDTLGTIGDETATQVADEIPRKINAGLGRIDTSAAVAALKGLNVPPEIANAIAQDMTASIIQGTTTGVDGAKMKIVEVFGNQGFVPKQLIEDQLVGAFTSGGQLSVTAAKNQFDQLPNKISFEQIASILGQSLDGSVQSGQAALNALTLDPTTVKKIQEAGKEGLKTGGDTGAEAFNQAVAAATPQLETAVSTGVQSGLAKAETEVQAWGERVGVTVEDALVNAGNNIGEGFKAELGEVVTTVSENFSELDTYIDKEAISGTIKESLLTPITEAQTGLTALTGPDDLGSGAESLAAAFKEATGAKLGDETKNVSNNVKSSQTATKALPGHMRSAATSARTFAQNLERAASAAKRASSYKFAGGPVSPGQTYTVNEFGREMFQSNTGRISEIKVPKFGQWTPPTSGTVIPAHIANQIRDGKESSKVSSVMNSAASATMTKIKVQQASNDSGNLQRALVRELKKLDNGGSVSNQITIQSQAPVNDASRMLAEMNRLRAYRR